MEYTSNQRGILKTIYPHIALGPFSHTSDKLQVYIPEQLV